MTPSNDMSNWFVELAQGWDVEFAGSDLPTLGDSHVSLAEAWEAEGDSVRLWLCARFAETPEARRWCLGTGAACVAELFSNGFGGRGEGAPLCPELDVFESVLDPLRGKEPSAAQPVWVSSSELAELVEAVAHYYEAPRALLSASQLDEKISAGLANEVARIRRSGREPEPLEAETRLSEGVRNLRSKFARALVEAYSSAQAAVSAWRSSRGQPFSRWGTDVVRTRHRVVAGRVETVC